MYTLVDTGTLLNIDRTSYCLSVILQYREMLVEYLECENNTDYDIMSLLGDCN